MPPEVVAAKTIKAMRKRRHEIILSFGGRIIVWLGRIIIWLGRIIRHRQSLGRDVRAVVVGQ